MLWLLWLLWWPKLDEDSHSFTFICLFVSDLYFHARVNCCTAQLSSHSFSLPLQHAHCCEDANSVNGCRSVGRSPLCVCASNFGCLLPNARFSSRPSAERISEIRSTEHTHITPSSQWECDFDSRITCYDIHMQLVGRFMRVY